ncbi:MAG: phage holin family protein [Bacteroidales bacterium]|nr:phage holin family protein [Bacteroidales bacterium]
MAIFNNDKKYKWEFVNLGGSSRVRIASGEDIAHLAELDPKMWTVLSCPSTGLEIDEKSLAYMDIDGDGKIRVNDVIATSQWVTGALKNNDLILEGKDYIDVEEFNQENEAGKKLYFSAKQILENLGKEGTVITLADTVNLAAIFANTRFNGDGVITEATSEDADDKAAVAAAVAAMGGVADRSGAAGVNADLIEGFYKNLAAYVAWAEAAVEAPYGDKTDAAIEAYNALDAKVKDFFMRSKLAAFSPDSTASLDVQTSGIQAISAENLTGKVDEIASYPIARVTGKAEIDLTAPVNPAWAAKFELVKSVAFADKKVLTEADWAAVGAEFAAYTAWKGSKAGACVESLGLDAIKDFLAKDRKAALLDLVAQDAALAEEASNIELVNKFLHIFRDLYRLIRNFVTLDDFYTKDKDVSAIFQSGRLIIDQRECRFCMNVADMGKHNASAATSGMFLVYCDCSTKLKPGKITIVAAVTVGEIGDLIVGKNAVYYDNAGVEWDAVITKIIDNPISVAQAFWSPYRRMATAVENLINKSAADKDAKILADATAKINAAPAAGAAGAAPAQPFDIGKFAGIFAAFGMALGALGTALTTIFSGVLEMPVWKTALVIVAILLLISGPAMVMAWMKLRRRNIAPLLNANGWAVNAASKISIPFGETLTDVAKYPKMKLKDPYAKAGIPTWKKCVITLVALALVAGGLWIFNLLACVGLNSPLPRYNQPEEVVECSDCTGDCADCNQECPDCAMVE